MELTGGVSRPFMMKWDKIYQEKVKQAGILMPLYTRYVDDSNQAAMKREGQSSEELLAELLEIANSIQD